MRIPGRGLDTIFSDSPSTWSLSAASDTYRTPVCILTIPAEWHHAVVMTGSLTSNAKPYSTRRLPRTTPRAGRRDHRRDCRGHRLATTHGARRSEEHTSELQSLMRISYAV